MQTQAVVQQHCEIYKLYKPQSKTDKRVSTHIQFYTLFYYYYY